MSQLTTIARNFRSPFKELFFVMLSVFLFSLAQGNLIWLLLVAFVPFLYIEHKSRTRLSISQYLLVLGSFSVLYNAVMFPFTQWIWLLILGDILMLLAYRLICTQFKDKIGRIALVALFLGKEYLLVHYANLGFGVVLGEFLAVNFEQVLWFHLAGSMGGTLWIVLINVLIFRAIESGLISVYRVIWPVLFMIIPFLINDSDSLNFGTIFDKHKKTIHVTCDDFTHGYQLSEKMQDGFEYQMVSACPNKISFLRAVEYRIPLILDDSNGKKYSGFSFKETGSLYAKHGDYLGRLGLFMSLVLLLSAGVRFRTSMKF